MLGEYKVNRCTRRCHTADRPLREGEWYFSVVIEKDDHYERRDFSAESWTGPPDEAIGWWKNRMPTADEKKMVLAPPEVLVDLLRQMADIPTQAQSRYLLALMLLRRKIVREIKTVDAPDREPTVTALHLEVSSDGTTLQVPVAPISRGEVESLTETLNDLLYCEADAEP